MRMGWVTSRTKGTGAATRVWAPQLDPMSNAPVFGINWPDLEHADPLAVG